MTQNTTSFMIKAFVHSLLLIIGLNVYAQETHYYKLSTIHNGERSNKNVSGGQFITFINSICFESTKEGDGVGHGCLTLNKKSSNDNFSTYQGSSYWGKETTFKFNADKSVLNVVLENGDVYVYKRATAPAGQETCSLIRKSDSENGGYTFTPSYSPQPNPVTTPVPSSVSTPTSTTPTSPSPEHRESKKAHSTYKTCHICHGSGVCSTCNGKGWYYNPYGTGTVTCTLCNKGKCRTCNGSGKVLGPIEYY